MSWKSVIGQERAKKILRSAIDQNRLSHAYLFTGAEGTGRSACAIELAKTLNCVKKQSEACDTCESCLLFETLQHPNVMLVFPLPAGKNEKVGDSPVEKLSDDDILLIQEELKKKAEDPYHEITVPRATGIKINSIREIRRASSLSMARPGKRVFIVLE